MVKNMRTAGRRKITYGWVTQTFDPDGKCIEQEFTAGDQVEYETDEMEHLHSSEMEDCEYQPFHMVQPQAMAVALVGSLSEGYGAVGPFTNSLEAARWAEDQEAWIMTMQSPYEEFDSAKTPLTTIPVIGTMGEDGQVKLKEPNDG